MTCKISKVISGAQTGADLGGLIAAKALSIPTGGMMPKGFKNEAGFKPEYRERYNLVESSSDSYPHRTKMNVINSTFTLLVGNMKSKGCTLTINLCRKYNRPYIVCPLGRDNIESAWQQIEPLVNFYPNPIMNVAGNRESVSPGIQDFTKMLVAYIIIRATI